MFNMGHFYPSLAPTSSFQIIMQTKASVLCYDCITVAYFSLLTKKKKIDGYNIQKCESSSY